MKKLFLGLVLVLVLVVGCKGNLTIPDFAMPSVFLKGLAGVSSNMFAADHRIDTIEGANVTIIKYAIADNIGGAGTVGIGITAFGGDCSLVTPTVTLSIQAATNISMTDVNSVALVALQNQYYAVGQHRICIFYTQADINAPLNLTFRTWITVNMGYEIKTGL